jgi:hypothetical protein
MNAPRSSQAVPGALYWLDIDGRGLSVALVPGKVRSFAAMSLKTVLEDLAARGVPISESMRGTLAETICLWQMEPASAATLVLAQARPPKHGRHGQLAWSPACADAAAGQVRVAPGQVLATISPPTAGTPGRDVFGQIMPPRPGRPCPTVAAQGCHFDAATGRIVADIAGTLKAQGSAISVSAEIKINGDVTAATGPVGSEGDLTITGGVQDGATVKAADNISIGGSVGAAVVQAGGDLTIRGALAGKHQGLVLAGHNLLLNSCEDALAVAERSIRIAHDSANSQLYAGGPVECAAGTLSGGMVAARGGLIARTLGSSNHARLVVLAGIDWHTRILARPVHKQAQSISERIRRLSTSLAALRANARRLTPPQREQMTGLEFQLQELQSQHDAVQETLSQYAARSNELCRQLVYVSQRIYPGIELCLGRCRALVDHLINGPVTFQLADVAGKPTVVATLPNDRQLNLPTQVADDPFDQIRLPDAAEEFFAARGTPAA